MGTTQNGNLDKDGYEKEWVAELARRRLGTEDKVLWNESRYTVRPYVYHDKIFIGWAYAKGEPLIKDVFTVVGIDVSFQDGTWIKVSSKGGTSETAITHTPRRLPGLKVFAWVPFFNEMRFASADWDNLALPRSLRLSACFKMAGKPDVFAEHQDHLSELHVFRQLFPKYAETRF